MAHHTGAIGVGGGGRFGSNQFGDTTFTKIFVGGLAWETQRDTMRRHFEQYGEILEAVVITDKNTGRSKGYGFVTFRDPEAARKACEDPSPVIDGRRANCNLASLGSRGPRPSAPSYGMRLRPLHSPSPSSPTAAPSYAAAPPQAFSHVVPFPYQQGYAYPSYGYPQYSPDYSYQQSLFNPYGTPQYAAIYGGSGGTVSNPAIYAYSPLQAGAASYQPLSPYGLQSPQLIPYSVAGASPIVNIPPYGAGLPLQTAVPSSGFTSIHPSQGVPSTPGPGGGSSLQPLARPASPHQQFSQGVGVDQQPSN